MTRRNDELKARAERLADCLKEPNTHINRAQRDEAAALIGELVAERERLTALAERWDMDGKLDADRVGYVGGAKQRCAADLRAAMEGT